MVSADCEPTSASRIRCSSEKLDLWIVTTPSSTALCSAYMIGLTIYRIKRPRIGNLSSGPTILLLKPNCLRWRRSEEIADNIEDHLTGGEDHAPRGPLSKLS